MGQWISPVIYFHVTSSVFDFFFFLCPLEIGHGVRVESLISPARNWTCLSCLSDDGLLMGGPIFGRGIALMWALMSCRTQRREDQGSVIVGGEGKTITDVARGGGIRAVCLSQSPSPSDTLSDPVQMARNHLHQKARSQARARAPSSILSFGPEWLL